VNLRTAPFDGLDGRTLYGLLRLRIDVFVVEQRAPYPELDGRDLEPGTVHIWLEEAGGGPAAYLRLLAEPDGSARIGRVCTAPDHRRAGVAARLVAAALEHADGRTTVLDAQSYLVAFYERFGFVPTGPEFVDPDGIPHVPMSRPAMAGPPPAR
jgi:ElaA protein